MKLLFSRIHILILYYFLCFDTVSFPIFGTIIIHSQCNDILCLEIIIHSKFNYLNTSRTNVEKNFFKKLLAIFRSSCEKHPIY